MKFCLAFFAFFAALVLSSCGDSENYVVGGDGGANYRFYYYYSQECDYDALGEYGCYTTKSLPSSMSIRLIVNRYGDAQVWFDGYSYSYYDDDYDFAWDDETMRYYYQFALGRDYLTIYEDGSEAIYTNANPLYEIHYYYDL